MSSFMKITGARLALVTAAALGHAAGRAFRPQPAVPSPAPSLQASTVVEPCDHAERFQAFRQDLDQLRRAVRRLEHDRRSIEERIGAAATVEETLDESPPSERSRARSLRDTSRDLARFLTEESEDPGWAAEAYGEIVRTFEAQPPIGAYLVDVDCRTSICGATLVLEDERAVDAALQALPDLVPWDGQIFAHPDPHDPLVLAIYAAREGHSLPPLGGERR